MENDRDDAEKKAKQQSVLSDKEEFGGDAEKKLKQMGDRSSAAAEKATSSKK